MSIQINWKTPEVKYCVYLPELHHTLRSIQRNVICRLRDVRIPLAESERALTESTSPGSGLALRSSRIVKVMAAIMVPMEAYRLQVLNTERPSPPTPAEAEMDLQFENFLTEMALMTASHSPQLDQAAILARIHQMAGPKGTNVPMWQLPEKLMRLDQLQQKIISYGALSQYSSTIYKLLTDLTPESIFEEGKALIQNLNDLNAMSTSDIRSMISIESIVTPFAKKLIATSMARTPFFESGVDTETSVSLFHNIILPLSVEDNIFNKSALANLINSDWVNLDLLQNVAPYQAFFSAEEGERTGSIIYDFGYQSINGRLNMIALQLGLECLRKGKTPSKSNVNALESGAALKAILDTQDESSVLSTFDWLYEQYQILRDLFIIEIWFQPNVYNKMKTAVPATVALETSIGNPLIVDPLNNLFAAHNTLMVGHRAAINTLFAAIYALHPAIGAEGALKAAGMRAYDLAQIARYSAEVISRPGPAFTVNDFVTGGDIPGLTMFGDVNYSFFHRDGEEIPKNTALSVSPSLYWKDAPELMVMKTIGILLNEADRVERWPEYEAITYGSKRYQEFYDSLVDVAYTKQTAKVIGTNLTLSNISPTMRAQYGQYEYSITGLDAGSYRLNLPMEGLEMLLYGIIRMGRPLTSPYEKAVTILVSEDQRIASLLAQVYGGEFVKIVSTADCKPGNNGCAGFLRMVCDRVSVKEMLVPKPQNQNSNDDNTRITTRLAQAEIMVNRFKLGYDNMPFHEAHPDIVDLRIFDEEDRLRQLLAEAGAPFLLDFEAYLNSPSLYHLLEPQEEPDVEPSYLPLFKQRRVAKSRRVKDGRTLPGDAELVLRLEAYNSILESDLIRYRELPPHAQVMVTAFKAEKKEELPLRNVLKAVSIPVIMEITMNAKSWPMLTAHRHDAPLQFKAAEDAPVEEEGDSNE